MLLQSCSGTFSPANYTLISILVLHLLCYEVALLWSHCGWLGFSEVGLAFEADFTHFREPGIAAAFLHPAHLILCQRQSIRPDSGSRRPRPLLCPSGWWPWTCGRGDSPWIAGSLDPARERWWVSERALNLVTSRRVSKHRVAHIIFGGFCDPL